ncbi:hypothetical protein FGO68_gene9131 [Halteria grandinella]|uniref:Uncharacterized protein n=1 Tax=Halteria grandinella TaxID=5974 RepID=A0A8J8NB80_HALGN|nr:hypothetical protein FGO68_gene9131 [Halteria grandinella]
MPLRSQIYKQQSITLRSWRQISNAHQQFSQLVSRRLCRLNHALYQINLLIKLCSLNNEVTYHHLCD